MKISRSLTLVAIATLCTLPAFAQDSQSSAQNTNEHMIAQARVSDGPSHSITDEQRQKLSSLRDQFELSTAQKKAELDVDKRQLRQILHATTVDKQAALSLQSKINGLRDDLSNARLGLILAAGDVFTPEQRAEFKQMHHRWHHHHGGCSGACGGHAGHSAFLKGGEHAANNSIAPNAVGQNTPAATSTANQS